MNDYFHNKFPAQLALLTFSRPNPIVREHIMQDESVVFFGGRDWESAKTDLSRIPVSDRPKFILSLFMVVITDQCLYTHFKQTYQNWRRQTNFPKFGWSGLGPHNENPLKILWAPERDQVIAPEEIAEVLPDFVSFMKDEVHSYFTTYLPGVSARSFFNAIKNDQDYLYSEGTIIPRLKETLE